VQAEPPTDNAADADAKRADGEPPAKRAKTNLWSARLIRLQCSSSTAIRRMIRLPNDGEDDATHMQATDDAAHEKYPSGWAATIEYGTQTHTIDSDMLRPEAPKPAETFHVELPTSAFRFDDMLLPMAENMATHMLDQAWLMNHESLKFINILKCVTTTTQATDSQAPTPNKRDPMDNHHVGAAKQMTKESISWRVTAAKDFRAGELMITPYARIDGKVGQGLVRVTPETSKSKLTDDAEAYMKHATVAVTSKEMKRATKRSGCADSTDAIPERKPRKIKFSIDTPVKPDTAKKDDAGTMSPLWFIRKSDNPGDVNMRLARTTFAVQQPTTDNPIFKGSKKLLFDVDILVAVNSKKVKKDDVLYFSVMKEDVCGDFFGYDDIAAAAAGVDDPDAS
jgi:hypothetical protein